jgi:predicted amidophosphoribosyltransferase
VNARVDAAGRKIGEAIDKHKQNKAAEQRFCSKCDSAVGKTVSFCEKCGAKIGE